MTIHIQEITKTSTETENDALVDCIMESFWYNYQGSLNPANDAAVESLPGFLKKLVCHHSLMSLPLPQAYSDEGDVCLMYPTIHDATFYLDTELPRLKGVATVFRSGQKELDTILDGTKYNDIFWRGLGTMLEDMYGKSNDIRY